ncbi:MAG: hypothetical protein K2M06_04035 [Muribaculaceae bacterium]|nr:hypothetical protein [Muribaculaceae bacterium]
MKKIKFIVAATVRGAMLISPGAAFAVWQWAKVPTFINILASVGVESLFLFVFAVVKTAVDITRKRSRDRNGAAGTTDTTA